MTNCDRGAYQDSLYALATSREVVDELVETEVQRRAALCDLGVG